MPFLAFKARRILHNSRFKVEHDLYFSDLKLATESWILLFRIKARNI